MKKMWGLLYVIMMTAPAMAYDDGYYSSWQSFLNVLWPPKADHLITEAEKRGHYPLLSNPANYEDHPEGQDWNLVYVPYCTGDIYAGDKVEIYEDPSGVNPPLEWHHNGLVNMRAINAWLRGNMQQPSRMMVTGCSAGQGGIALC
ncbi:pectinacetylesterase family protein [Shewanella surugensis]|uniref:Pectinacetylesterase family protein n=1 Tax=Shewanella surugensis TaxID=212020 RepID=A0ABT0LGU3_9GAMM|nr:pectinacetylesterase family protein [Shewanella surugensis]MCL1126919.1 pectinacetylesterase family protein [Shewanella surugensis]